MKECITDISDVVSMSSMHEFMGKLNIAVDEGHQPSIALLRVLYEGETDVNELIKLVGQHLKQASNLENPLNLIPQGAPQIIDSLAAHGSYFALMFQMSDEQRAREAFQSLRNYLLQQPGLQHGVVDIKAKIATYNPPDPVESLITAAERAPLE